LTTGYLDTALTVCVAIIDLRQSRSRVS